MGGRKVSSEIYWLTLTTLLTALLFIPYAYIRIAKITFFGALRRPVPGDAPFEEAWGHRAYRAHMNAFESLIVFAPLAIAVHVTGSANEITAAACQIHFWARLAHAPIYWLNIPWIRTPTYFVGLAASLVLASELLT